MRGRVSPFQPSEREALGYKEHAGSISVCRSSSPIPSIDWDAVIANEPSHIKTLLPLSNLSMIHDIHCYAIEGRLAQHTDCVSWNDITSGIILDCQEDLELNASGKRIKVGVGDQFILNPHVRHGAETSHRLIFAAIDEDRRHLPAATEYRSIFHARLEEVAKQFPLGTRHISEKEHGT